MKETVSGRALWNDAAKTGLVLGGVCILYNLIVSLLVPGEGTGGLVAGLMFGFRTLLWIAKVVGCLFLMRFFLLRICLKYDGVTQQHVFRYGVRIALLSALVYSAYVLSDAILLKPEAIDALFESISSSLGSMMDSNTQAALDLMRQNYPQYLFFGNFIYCFLFGTVLSRLYSRELPPSSLTKADPQ